MNIIRPIVFFDLETTGVSPEKDRIVEIACLKISPVEENGIMTTKIEEKKAVLNPTIPIPKEASDVHGFTDEKVKDCPRFIELSKSLYSFFKDCDFGGFNSDSYDIPLLSQEFARCNIVFPDWDCAYVDVLKFERALNPNKLADVYKRYTGQDLEGAHGAENDIRATVDVLLHQLKKIGKEGMTPSEIDLFCQGDKKRFDLSGKCYVDNENVVRWAFGKNQDKPVLEDKGYLEWVLKSDFSIELKNKLRKLQNDEKK